MCIHDVFSLVYSAGIATFQFNHICRTCRRTYPGFYLTDTRLHNSFLVLRHRHSCKNAND